jgi:hypothetical protein
VWAPPFTFSVHTRGSRERHGAFDLRDGGSRPRDVGLGHSTAKIIVDDPCRAAELREKTPARRTGRRDARVAPRCARDRGSGASSP